MSKSYNNIIPLLGTEEELKKSVMKIVTNSQEPGEKKEWKENTLFSIYSSFANEVQIADLKAKFNDGIGWGDAKLILFQDLNEVLLPIREKFQDLQTRESDIEELLQVNAKKVRKFTIPFLEKNKISSWSLDRALKCTKQKVRKIISGYFSPCLVWGLVSL